VRIHENNNICHMLRLGSDYYRELSRVPEEQIFRSEARTYIRYLTCIFSHISLNFKLFNLKRILDASSSRTFMSLHP
jgi:hypothetical protein